MPQSNIATAINAAHAGVEAAQKEGTRYAIEAGRLLTDAKATVVHGGWDAWVRKHCRFSPRTARLYVAIFRHVEADPAKRQRVAELSLRDAANEIAQPKPGRTMGGDNRQETVDLVAAWLAVPFVVRKRFLDELLDRGDIDAKGYARMMRGADRVACDENMIRAVERDFGHDGMVALDAAFAAASSTRETKARFKQAMNERGL